MKLQRSFFKRDTIVVAKDLLGKVLVRKIGKKEIRAIIVETEAYIGEEDQACHARFGRTKRNGVMYGKAGGAYVYLCYGIHELLNIVTEKEGFPAAVLVRGVKIGSFAGQVPNGGALQERKLPVALANPLLGILPCRNRLGPGKLTKYLHITRKLNKEDLTKSTKLWVENFGLKIKKLQIKSAKRIGVSYAGKWAKKKWRFFIE